MAESQATPDKRLQRKREFEECFNALADDDDDILDSGLSASLIKLHSKSDQIAHCRHATVDINASSRPRASDVSRTTISRSKSDADLTSRAVPSSLQHDPPSRAARQDVEVIELSPIASRQTVEIDKPPPSAIPRVLGKRKRDNDIKQVRQEIRIFQGLQWYFFPNNDIHLARRLRIIKAIEYGASWQKEFNNFVTHIIVDKGLDYASLLKFLKVKDLPASISIVNETWPSDCIAFKLLLNPKRSNYWIPGAPAPWTDLQAPSNKTSTVALPTSSATSDTSDTSLSLKPAGKTVQARRPSTPSPVATEPVCRRDGSTIASTDEFDAAVNQAKRLSEVPLEDEEASSRPSSSGSSSAMSDTSDFLHTSDNPRNKLKTVQSKFQCMESHTADAVDGPNTKTLKILQQMTDYYGQVGDEWRLRAYRKAIATLRKHPQKISTKEQALALPNIGERLAAKIEEIAVTHKLRRLESARAEPQDHVLQAFMQVYGVGFAQASKWVQEGMTTLDEVLARQDLTTNQRIGIEHYEDFNMRIPRAEVEEHGSFVRKALQKVDSAFELIIGGSYRRGSKDSGDVDCVITHPKFDLTQLRSAVFRKLVSQLTRDGFLVANLTPSSRGDGSVWHGASRLPSSTIWRRIDMLLVPGDEIGAAMIYFTGNDIFNRSMRLLASYKGMRLNQRGLFKDVIRGKGRLKITEGTLVEGKSERRIFEILGVPWREPWERII